MNKNNNVRHKRVLIIEAHGGEIKQTFTEEREINLGYRRHFSF
jgi:hypothetical protein